MHAHQIGRVVPQAFEVVYTVVAAHIPADVMRVPHHDFGNGSSPATTSHYCYFTAIKHG